MIRTQIKFLGTMSLMGFLVQKHHRHISVFSLTGEECALFDPLQNKKGIKETYSWILPDSTCVFPPYDLSVCIYYSTVINLNHEYNHMLIPGNLLVNIQMHSWSSSLCPGFPFLILLYWFSCSVPLGASRFYSLLSIYCFLNNFI